MCIGLFFCLHTWVHDCNGAVWKGFSSVNGLVMDKEHTWWLMPTTKLLPPNTAVLPALKHNDFLDARPSFNEFSTWVKKTCLILAYSYIHDHVDLAVDIENGKTVQD